MIRIRGIKEERVSFNSVSGKSPPAADVPLIIAFHTVYSVQGAFAIGNRRIIAENLCGKQKEKGV